MSKHNGRAMLEVEPAMRQRCNHVDDGRGEPMCGSDWRKVRLVDDPEQELKELKQEAYREAAERCLRMINVSLSHIGSRLLTPKGTMLDVLTDFWAVAIVHGSFLCGDRSLSEIANMIGVSRATLSAQVVLFASGNDLPPSPLMRDADTMKAYMEARLQSVERENAKDG